MFGLCARAQAQDADAGAPLVLEGIDAGAAFVDAATPELVAPIVLVAPVPPLPDPILSEPNEFGASARIERPAGPGEYAQAGTGSRINAPLEELPATVNIIKSETLRERGAVDISQALSLLPGIVAPNTYGGFVEIQSRGFQAIPLNDGRRDARAIRATSAPQAGLFDLDRIEVLRGPSSVLYGFGAIGGVVNLIRKRASATPGYELELGLGTPGQYRAHVGAQGAITDTLSYRADLGHISYENFRGYKSQRSQVATTLRYQPARRHTFNVRFAYSFDKYNTDVGIPTIESATRPGKWVLPYGVRYGNRYNSKQDYFNYQRMEAAADYRYDISKATYIEARGAITQDDYQYLAAESLNYVGPTATSRAQVEREYLWFKRNWRPIYGSVELHHEQQTGPLQHQLVLGYNIDSFAGVSTNGDPTDVNSGEDAAALAPVDFSVPVDNSAPVAFVRSNKNHYRTATHSVYGFDHIKITDELILTGGFRLDRLRNRTRRDFLDRTGASIPDATSGEFRRPAVNKDFGATGNVGLVYNVIKPLTGYVSYASGFLPQFTSPRDATVAPKYEPERSQQFEGGLRVRVEQANHVFTVDAAGYLIRKKNMLVPRGMNDSVAAGLAQSRGVDLMMHYAAPRYFSLDGGYSLIDAEYKKFIGYDAVTGDQRDFKGNKLSRAPRHSGTVWARSQLTDKIRLGVGSRIMGKQWADDQNRFEMPNYALLDASVSYGSEHATFTISANNILNRTDYINSVINAGNPQIQVTPGAGREVLGTLRLAL